MPSELQIEAAREEHKYYPYTGIFFANRHSFWSAGQDSFTLPPAQNPDLFIALTNVEPVLQGVLQRRRGYTLFSNQNTTAPFTLGYSFRSENLALREVVFTSSSNVAAYNEDGTTALATIFTPSAGALKPRMVLSRDYGYFSDGILADSKKWNGTTATGNLTKWGIDINSAAAAAGTNPGGTATDLLDRNASWSNVGNATGNPDGLFATASINASNKFTNTLLLTNFGFSIPNTQTIAGFQINVTWKTDHTSSVPISPFAFAQIVKGGNAVGTIVQSARGSLVSTTQSLGSSTFLWGASWLPADINASNFGVQVYFGPSPSSPTVISLDAVTITVFTAAGPLTVGTPGAGSITLLNGRTYFYVGLNSKTGATSGLPFASVTTGPLTNNNVPLSAIGAFGDTQVDTVLILATADGNDQTTLFQIGSVVNGTTTFTDNMPDSTLLTQPLYLNTDQAGIIHGVANNNPPPAINFPTKHKGRLYGAVGRALVFSKNLDEVTTANGLITSKWEEAWPATNQFDISEQAETIQGLLTDGETLWIATERAIRRLIGDSPSNFQKPEVQFNEVGLLNQETWKVVFIEGQPVGTMWLTPDFRVIGSDFNTYIDVGTPIQDVLNSINPAAAQTAHAAYVNKGPADYYMLYIPTGSNTSPDTCCVFNLRSKKWFIWQPTDQMTASLFLIDGSGQPRWFVASQANPVYEWTSGTFQDRIGNTPVSYPATMQTSWLDLGDYTLRKFVNQIIPTTADQSAMTIQVDAASNELDFNNPLSVVAPTTVIPAAIPTDVFVPLASGPSHSRAFRFTFVSPPSTIGNILTGFSIEAGSFHKY